MSEVTTTAGAARTDPRPALICVREGNPRSAVKAALEQLGYEPEIPPGAAEATDRLRKIPYHVVVVDEGYDGATPLDNTVLKALNTMTMSVRRHMFVVLLGADVETLDHATAFARSVNAVVNLNDVGQLAAILRRAIADNDAFYRVFLEVLQAAGKR